MPGETFSPTRGPVPSTRPTVAPSTLAPTSEPTAFEFTFCGALATGYEAACHVGLDEQQYTNTSTTSNDERAGEIQLQSDGGIETAYCEAPVFRGKGGYMAVQEVYSCAHTYGQSDTQGWDTTFDATMPKFGMERYMHGNFEIIFTGF